MLCEAVAPFVLMPCPSDRPPEPLIGQPKEPPALWAQVQCRTRRDPLRWDSRVIAPNPVLPEYSVAHIFRPS